MLVGIRGEGLVGIRGEGLGRGLEVREGGTPGE